MTTLPIGGWAKEGPPHWYKFTKVPVEMGKGVFLDYWHWERGREGANSDARFWFLLCADEAAARWVIKAYPWGIAHHLDAREYQPNDTIDYASMKMVHAR